MVFQVMAKSNFNCEKYMPGFKNSYKGGIFMCMLCCAIIRTALIIPLLLKTAMLNSIILPKNKFKMKWLITLKKKQLISNIYINIYKMKITNINNLH